jgi:hypothetical protein
MNPATIWALLKNILPTKKIGAWILGILGALLALVMGVKNSDLKESFCASAPVELPKIEVQPAAAPAPVPAPEVKK